MAAILGNWPNDVMIEILSMLPAESLLEFKYVCKSWYALINDPKFVRKHLSNCPQHDHILINRRTEQMENVFSIFSYNVFESFLDVDLPLDFPNFLICGHSNGLICLSNKWSIFLCNPTTRELRKLPPSILLLTENDDMVENSVGFGYDPKSKDFKVIRALYFYGNEEIPSRGVEIYDLSKDRWREIESPFCGDVSWLPYFQTNEGTCFLWVDVYEGTEMILTFDLSEEVFNSILVSEEIKEQPHHERTFGVLNGCILVINYDADILHVWKLNKDESRGFSWSELYTINDVVIEIIQPLLFVSYDELLVEVTHGRVVLYNMKTRHFKTFPIEGQPFEGQPFKFQATFFVKGLMSLK